jgi:hypothetical protein
MPHAGNTKKRKVDLEVAFQLHTKLKDAVDVVVFATFPEYRKAGSSDIDGDINNDADANASRQRNLLDVQLALTKAFATGTGTHMYLSTILAKIVIAKYGFMYCNDPRYKDAHHLYRFDGVIFKRENDQHKSELYLRTQIEALRMVEMFEIEVDGLIASARGGDGDNDNDNDNDDNGDDDDATEDDGTHADNGLKKETLEQLKTTTTSLRTSLANHRFMHTVFVNTDHHMRSESEYKKLGMPTPSELWKTLDCRQDILAFTNGVLHLGKDAFTFYKKGDVKIQKEFNCTFSTGHEYVGPDKWIKTPEGETPLDGAVNDILRAELAELETYFIKKVFFRPRDFEAAKDVIACFVTGNYGHKKIFLLLGERGNNGKTGFSNMIQVVLGSYGGIIPKEQLIDTGSKRSNDNDHTATLNHIVRKRAVFCSEAKRTDMMDSDRVKRMVGDDKQQLRPMYGEPYEAKMTFSVAMLLNDMPRFDTTDAALSEGRFYALTCDARFEDGNRQDDFTNGMFKKLQAAEVDDKVKKNLSKLSLLFLSYVRSLMDRDNVLTPAPTEGAASEAVKAIAGDTNAFVDWCKDNLVSALRKGSDTHTDWETYPHAGIKQGELLAQYKKENDGNTISVQDVKKLVEKAGFAFKSNILRPENTSEGIREQKVNNAVAAWWKHARSHDSIPTN